MRVEDPEVRDWFRAVLAAQTRDSQADARAQREELSRQASLLTAQQDRLLNIRLADEIDQTTFAAKHTELRDRLASIKLQLDVLDRSDDETPSSPRRCLNSRKHCKTRGKLLITRRSGESSKSSV
jgi:site-specific DNA recombinase